MINPKNYTHMSANGTKIISQTATNLGSVIINNAGASANTLTIYANSSAVAGSEIAVIDTVELNGNPRVFDVSCPAGLTAVMGTGTTADVTITHE